MKSRPKQKTIVSGRAQTIEVKRKVKKCNREADKNSKFKNRNILFFGVVSLLWLLFRTGTKPSRAVYPCQRAALANTSMLLSVSVPLSLASVATKAKKFLGKKGTTLALLVIMASVVLSSEQFWGSLRLVRAVNPDQEIQIAFDARSATAFPASDIYVVNGRTNVHVSELVNLMGSQGLLLYRSNTSGVNLGPSGLIAHDDVVLIKINEEWDQRGGTNTDKLKELIQAILNHPDGFIGEIVVADNGQWRGSMNWPQSNAEDHGQSTQDVVNTFTSHKVSTYTWMPIRTNQVQEFSDGDMTDGYVRYSSPDPDTGLYVSYPKFTTSFGTRISLKHGIWNGTYNKTKLKIINMPVLKSHGNYGVTASLKHYMGVLSEQRAGGLSNGHDTVATGGMGTMMAELGLPTLNIIDAIWVNANPPPAAGSGPNTPYGSATRVDVLVASTDPVALDYWSAKHVLVETAKQIGYSDTHTLDPDSLDSTGVNGEAFGVWLRRTQDELLSAGYNVTINEDQMNIYVDGDSTPPDIGVPSQNPPRDNVMADQEVKVSVNVTDVESGVKNVTLFYTIENGTAWENRSMNYNSSTSLYEATIPGQQAGAWVRFEIVAFDNAGNNATRDGVEPYFTYQVIPEFSSFIILPLFIMATLLAAIVYIRNRPAVPKRIE